MRLLLFLFFGSACLNTVVSQNITIKGRAHASHIGKEVVLSDYSDYITYTKTKESIDTVDKDGYFELKLQSNNTKPVLISIGNLTGKIYVQPNFVYGISFPAKDSLTNNQEGTESNVDISVFGKDSTELNALIIDFNTQYNNLFLNSNDKYLSPVKINAMLDTFLITSRDRYKSLKNTYFKTYIEYSFADFFSNTSRGKTFLYKQFIEHKPILYSNYEYMLFFNSYYKGYLKAFASTKNGGSIYNSINAFADYQDLKNQFSSDKNVTNDTLRELLLLKGLIDFYYSPDFDKKQVQSVIEQLYRDTKITEHQKIALNLLQTIYQLQPGADAPDFIANDRTGNPTNLLSDKGKYIYLNFFTTKSENSLREMQKIVDLKKKFNDKVTFVSVCLDDSMKTYIAYLKANPKQDWVILYQDKNSTAKQAYKITGFSGFFFINLQKQLAQSPALSPSEGIEYKFHALFRPKRKNTIIGIR